MSPDSNYPSIGTAPTNDPVERKEWILARAHELDRAWEEDPESAPEPRRAEFRKRKERRRAFMEEAQRIGLVPALRSLRSIEPASVAADLPLDREIGPILVEALPRAWYTRLAVLGGLCHMAYAPATPALIADYWRATEFPRDEKALEWSAAAIVSCMTTAQRPLLIELAERLDPSSNLSTDITLALGKIRRKSDRERVIEILRRWLLACPFFELHSIARAARSLKAFELLPDLRQAAARLEAMPVPPRTRFPKGGTRESLDAWSHESYMRDLLVDAKKRYPPVLAKIEAAWRTQEAR